MRTKVSPLAIGIGVVAALCGWAVRGVHFDEIEAASVPVPQPAAIQPHEEMSLHVERPYFLTRTSSSKRSLFSYVEPPLPLPARGITPEPTPIVVPPPAIVTALPVEQRARLQFAHRYIGNFGTRAQPIAAFSHEGTIVTARIGDRIDANFVLRSIGIESVEVEAVVNGERQVERRQLGG